VIKKMKSKAAASHDDDDFDPSTDIWEDKDANCGTGHEEDSAEELNDELDRDNDNGATEDTSEDEDDNDGDSHGDGMTKPNGRTWKIPVDPVLKRKYDAEFAATTLRRLAEYSAAYRRIEKHITHLFDKFRAMGGASPRFWLETPQAEVMNALCAGLRIGL